MAIKVNFGGRSVRLGPGVAMAFKEAAGAAVERASAELMERAKYGAVDDGVLMSLFWQDEAREAERKPMASAEVPMPVKQPVTISVSAPDAEYIALAQELGVFCPAMLQARLEAFFVEQFIDVYPIESVKRYMDALARAETAKRAENVALSVDEAVRRGGRIEWYWRALRETDAQLAGGSPYDKPVPKPVLLTVKKVSAAFPEVRFFVSDYQAVRPDPFLMVTAPGLPQYVIERWDEPGFRA